jgi:hypothetical protein
MFGPWVELATMLMDGDGAWTAYPWPGAPMEQPDGDMTILSAIRSRWNERRAKDITSGAKRR